MTKLVDWLFSLNIRLMSDKSVRSEYFYAAGLFSEAVDGIIFGGRCIGFKRLYLKWRRWEKEWGRRGFRPIDLERFSWRFVHSLDTLKEKYVDNRLKPGEVPTYFADGYFDLAFEDE